MCCKNNINQFYKYYFWFLKDSGHASFWRTVPKIIWISAWKPSLSYSWDICSVPVCWNLDKFDTVCTGKQESKIKKLFLTILYYCTVKNTKFAGKCKNNRDKKYLYRSINNSVSHVLLLHYLKQKFLFKIFPKSCPVSIVYKQLDECYRKLVFC